MKETIRRLITQVREDKLIRRLLFGALILVCISASAFILKGPSKASDYHSVNPNDYFTQNKNGIINTKTPAVIMLCGIPMMMVEPKEDGTTTIFGGKENVKERLKQIPKTPIIMSEISKSYRGISCDAILGIPRGTIEPGPSMNQDPVVPNGAPPPGYLWSA